MRGWDRSHATTTELNFELYFVTEVLHLRSLHYGYWDGPRIGKGIDLEQMARAQTRFTERLLEFVPPNVKHVLDVGAGIGDNARALARAGHRVMAISPDANHARYFAEIEEPNVSFRQSSFEAFESEERFDLVLFSESHRYFDRRFGLRRAAELLRPGGHLLVSGMFPNEQKAPYAADFDIADLPYLQIASECGFDVIRLADITSNILPTVEMIDHSLTEYVEPTIRFADAYLAARSPWKRRLARLFLSKEDAELGRIRKKLRRKTNPARFRGRVRYVTILFEARSARSGEGASKHPRQRSAPDAPLAKTS
jgi:SAM-dependent methyltransferase